VSLFGISFKHECMRHQHFLCFFLLHHPYFTSMRVRHCSVRPRLAYSTLPFSHLNYRQNRSYILHMAGSKLDPILSLTVPNDDKNESNNLQRKNAVSSICFLPTTAKSYQGSLAIDEFSDDSSNDSDDSGDFQLRCRSLVQREPKRRDGLTSASQMAATLSLPGRHLASCGVDGTTTIWDLSSQRSIGSFSANRGPGLLLCRIEGTSNNLLYQTRNDKGTVSLHDIQTASDNGATTATIISSIDTYSVGFCCAAPCVNNSHLVALPTDNKHVAHVRDWRLPPLSKPAATIEGDLAHGMLTSLALCETTTRGRLVLSCGTESGHVVVHDLAMTNRTEFVSSSCCNVQLTNDPILSIDSTPSQQQDSVVVIAGMAADAAELVNLPQDERGTVAVIKTTVRDGQIHARLRARRTTCDIGTSVSSARKPGVSLCRFRPDGRLFAVGGWDHRLRVFGRSETAEPLAILRGHSSSVNAIDWAPDASESGLLATGAADGRVHVWRCFSSTGNIQR
jgi:WD40 repeat protein